MRHFTDEAGYSLVEVLVAILILSIAIIPMVNMFDFALKTTTTSGNYDKARSFANQKLEQAKNLPYSDARDDFPAGCDANPSSQPCAGPASDLPPGLTSYEVTKTLINKELNPAPDGDLMRIEVTVRWGDGKEYIATGVTSDIGATS